MIHNSGHRPIAGRFIAVSIFILGSLIATAVLGQSPATKDTLHVLWQNMPFIALNNGDFEGTVSVQEAVRHGNIGIGAAQDLNGEVMLANGGFYRFAAKDGTASRMRAGDKLAYVAVGRLDTLGAKITLKPGTTFTGTDGNSLFAQLKPYLSNPNVYYALRITGGFNTVKARSFPMTVPYRPICQIQTEPYTFGEIRGTMAGFFSPSYMKNLNSANSEGLHLHFINHTYDRGGHVLDFTSAEGAQVVIMRYHQLDVGLPNTHTFSTTDLKTYYDASNCPK